MNKKYLEKKKEIIDILRNAGFKHTVSYNHHDQWYWFMYSAQYGIDKLDFYVLFEDSHNLISLNLANFQNYLDLDKIDTKDILQDLLDLSSYISEAWFYDDPKDKNLIKIYENEISRFNLMMRDYKLSQILQ